MLAPFLSTFVAWAAHEHLDARDALGALAGAIGAEGGVDLGAIVALGGLGSTSVDLRATTPVPPIPEGADRPELLGCAHEALLGAEHRHAKGVHYTPADVAAGVVASAFRSHGAVGAATTVCDPAAGGGAFLLAAARELEARGVDRTAIVEDLVWGVDIDPLAVAVTITALAAWASETGRLPRSTNVVVADSLRAGRGAWASAPAEGFDIVVGNPPFQSQLGTATARPAGAVDELRDRFGPALYRYADTAGLFLLEACRWAAPDARVALILSSSLLVADDAAPLRRAVLDLGVLDELWVAREPVFTAGVRVCAPVIAIGAPDPGRVRRAHGRGFAPAPDLVITHERLRAAPTWAEVMAGLFGVPVVALDGAETLASFCTATAGFRDQFYGIRPFVSEAAVDGDGRADGSVVGPGAGDARVRLITSGLIEPMRSAWGRRRTRFAGASYLAPVIDLGALAATDPKLMAWTEQRLVPKLIVATQTRVLETIVDEQGAWFPSVPTIAVTTEPDRLWEAAAVVMAPPISAWALGRHLGAALSSDAIKVSARQLLDAPLPRDRARWREACVPLRRAAAATTEEEWREALDDFGALMNHAYGCDDEVLEWWKARLPAWRG
jgi:hypothetical protein